ncbi:PREDICTED: uncharacterized protein LOC101302121 [Fragaria vesca subsp. vesca]|uniref:uncharacterized protein LOC101302121 n=1 Tax=Fragaria vesca subsp. vesca TaxID=101020 RepID=UPI0002C37103|nr:PREDICTED: uncharacterized protein LOC101302121 [Fragaria vesca subsp. vesca]
MADEIVPITLGWWEDYKSAWLTSRTKPPTQVNIKWSRPPPGCVKLNVDVAFDLHTGATKIDGVFRDYLGQCLGAFSLALGNTSSARHGELLALLEGVRVASQKKLYPLLVETNCHVLVTALHDDSLSWSNLSFLLSNLKEALALLRFPQR